MSDILEQCQKLFGTRDLYKVFDLPKNASEEKLKKAYYKISRNVHPDKVIEKDKSRATEKFQLLSKLHRLLSDKKIREIYNKTGEIDEEDDFGLGDGKEWIDYWRELFPTVTVDDIKLFESDFKGSEEEISSLKAAYISSKGNMQKIVESVLCATMDDEERFRAILEPIIESEGLQRYGLFFNESAASKKKRQSKAKKEAKEAEKAAKELKGGSLEGYNDLALALQRNKEKRGGILSYLEEKYCNAEEDDSDAQPKTSRKRAKASTSQSTGSKKKRQKIA